MDIKFHLCLLFSVFGAIACTPACENLLFGVTGGKLYSRTPPQYGSDNWLGSATEIGTAGWNDFKFLFFHPDGTLYGVLNDKFYKGPIPESSSAEDWIAHATLIGTAGWNAFQFLFFDPEGVLYGVHNDKFYKRSPPTFPSDNWIGSATIVGSGGWHVFKFLFFDPQGILYGVANGKFYKRSPPTHASDNWLGSSTLIGTGGWDGFQFLFFMADGELYGVHSAKFYKRSAPTHGSDNWLGSAEIIGTGGWQVFKYLMSPLGQPGGQNVRLYYKYVNPKLYVKSGWNPPREDRNLEESLYNTRQGLMESFSPNKPRWRNNLSSEEWSRLHEIKEDPTVRVLAMDKNLGPALISTEWVEKETSQGN
ncbi:Tachylectin-2 [Acropora cervicornis]|uniref:Tachylectin-2 n=1 Tax=Acropora cervicornis TaxID=6130 RepID=A0AAD9VAH4_ACRCE|nr:Tachylectin-2 [Acropora cervicornis]